jgi:hypothetical protein
VNERQAAAIIAVIVLVVIALEAGHYAFFSPESTATPLRPSSVLPHISCGLLHFLGSLRVAITLSLTLCGPRR